MQKTKKHFIIWLMVVATLISVQSQAGNVQEVDNEELAFTFAENPVKADSLYKDKKILVVGTVDKVQRGPVLVFPGVGKFGNILCHMRKSEKQRIASLDIPRELGIEGTCKGSLGNQIILKDCVIQRAWLEKQKKKQEEAADRAAVIGAATEKRGEDLELEDELIEEETADPETRLKELKKLVEKFPDDREANAALGHIYFKKIKKDRKYLPLAEKHLAVASGTNMDRSAKIEQWLGKARFELAYIDYKKGDGKSVAFFMIILKLFSILELN